MAALTVVTALTSTWVKVIVDGSDYVLQNIGSFPIQLFWKATQPTTSQVGMIVQPQNGVDSNTFLQGDVWARAKNTVGKISVNQ